MIVDVAHDDALAILTLNRPKARNALSIELCDGIVDALEQIDSSDARVVVIAGAGKVFCSGADFSAVSGPDAADFLPSFERMLEAVARFRLPTIASIHGAALGGGLQLATVCDFRIATDDAVLGIPSSKLGILVNFENVQRLVLLVGIGVAKEVLMTSRRYSGDEAATVGLVTRSVEPKKLRSTVRGLEKELAALAPLSVQGVKRSIQAVVDHMSAPTDPEIERLVAEAYGSEDLQEGLKAMAEKREPKFEGR